MQKSFSNPVAVFFKVITVLLIPVYPWELKAQCNNGLWSADWEVKASGVSGANEILADEEQNVYAIGQDENDQPSGLVIIKYNKAGRELWRRVHVEALEQTNGQAIQFDNKGNVVVTGYAFGSGHVVTVSYTPNGDFRWVNSFGSSLYAYMNPTDLATDNQGNAYVTGSVTPTGASDSYDIFVIKISNKGVLQWNKYYNGAASKLDVAHKIKVDKKGGVYVGGATTNGEYNMDFLTLKYNKNGSLAWAKTYNGPDNFSDEVFDLELGEKGDVVVTGYSYSGRATLRYDQNGHQKWARFSAGPYNTEHSLAIDKNGSAVISSSISTFDGIEITRYNESGQTEWVRTYLSATTIERDIQVDENHNIYVLGALLGSGSEPPSAVVLIYNQAGKQLFSDLYSFSNRDIVVREMALSCGGSFYFGAWDDFGQSDIITVRYQACARNAYVKECKKQNKGREGSVEQITEATDGILQVWPNPVLRNAQISFMSRVQGKLAFELYNIYGARIKTIWQGQAEAGHVLNISFQATGIAPGVYLLRGISESGEIYTQKVLVQ